MQNYSDFITIKGLGPISVYQPDTFLAELGQNCLPLQTVKNWSDKNVKNKWLNWHSSDIQAFRSPKSQMFILSLGSRGKETILFSQYIYIVVSNLLQTDGPSYILNTLHMFIVSYCWQKRFPPKEDTKMKTFQGLLKWKLSLITK